MSVSGSVNGSHAIATSDTDCKHVVSYLIQSKNKKRNVYKGKYTKILLQVLPLSTITA